MKELLQRWAQLEPDRCEILKGIVVILRDREPLCAGEEYAYSDSSFADTIQGAVQEAIEARGWDWKISSHRPGGILWAYLATIIEEDGERDPNLNGSPSKSLLGAYLKAIEQTKEEV